MKKVHIVALAGPKGEGKSTIAGEITQIVGEQNVARLSFANVLKNSLASMTGIPEKYFYDPDLKNVTPQGYECSTRDLMVGVGQLVKSLAGANVFVNTMRADIGKILDRVTTLPELLDEDFYIIIDDLRFEQELEMLMGQGAKIVYINPKPYDESVEISERGLFHRYDENCDLMFLNDKTNPEDPEMIAAEIVMYMNWAE